MFSSRIVISAAIASALFSCMPDIGKEEYLPRIHAEFDPASGTIPTPNDLLLDQKTGLVAIPTVEKDEDGNDAALFPPAMTEFVTGYVNTLNGFVRESTLTATFSGDSVDANTLNGDNILIYDVTELAAKIVKGESVEGTVPALQDGFIYKTTIKDGKYGKITQLDVMKAQHFAPGATYAVAFKNGIKDVNQNNVNSSFIFNFLKSKTPIVSDKGVSLIATSDADAVQLEEIRKFYDAIFKFFEEGIEEAKRIKREEIILFWTFTTTDAVSPVNDPSREMLPTPNDLLFSEGHLNFPIKENATAVEKEFFEWMNTLDGYSALSAPEFRFSAGIVKASVKAGDILFYDASSMEEIPGSIAVSDDGTEVVLKPASVLSAGKQYLIVVKTSVKDKSQRSIAPSPVTKMLLLENPLVKDGKSEMPLTLSDADASLLEQARLMYAPVVEALEGKGVKREDIALLFSFRVLSANEMLFDPNMGVIPYPNDVLLDFDSNSGKVKGVNLPVSEGDSDFMKYIKTELKKFDGFSTMPAISADFLKPLSPATLKFTPSLMEVGQFGIGIADITKVDPNDPGTLLNLVVMGADYFDSQMLGGKLLITTKPGKPLPPNGRFMIVLYDKLESADKGADGKPIPIHVSPVFFLARSKNPLVDENGKSNIKAVLSDSDAALLETLRLAYKPIFDVFEGFGIQRKRVLSFFTFTTMSTDAPLKEMYDQLQEAQHKPLISDGSLLAPDDDKVKGLFGGEPYDKISHVTPDGVLAGNILLEPNGVSDPLNPKLGKFPAKGENGYEFSMTNFEFIFFLPKGTPPYKVVIFQHEYMGEKEELYTIANDFAAKNLASIAIDMPYHGNHPHRIEGMPGGYGFLSPDIFADADNMRETALEHFQLVRLIKESLNTFIKVKLSIAEDRLNTDEIYYFGASMGGV
ncbi:MAG: Ig-like domain-containing protein, partial [Deltaproteobacteria bacterium]|nr:Ig-like domain-containing protein [Deltaproteobacteria bacterium]